MRLAVLLGDNLFADLSALPADAVIFMREDRELCSRFRHHQQKIVLFLSAMRHRRDELRQEGREVIYQELADGQFADALAGPAPSELHIFQPLDPIELPGIQTTIHPNPSFLTSDEDWAAFRRAKPRGIMADFYRRQRLQHDWLLTPDGKPEGGQWSFDAENRRPMPKGREGPPLPWVEPDAVTREVIVLVEREFPGHPGRAADFRWPVTRAQAVDWLEDFIQKRLPDFGAYEDALSPRDATLWHSLLSPLINLGLVLPGEAIDAALESYRQGWAPLNSVEGFVRQIGGWREFIRRIDIEYREAGAEFKGLGENRRLGPQWWTGETGLPPLDDVIRRAQQRGWAHHIERLMVAGCLMTLCEIDPEEGYRWFMEMFIDSAEWVMRPNVFGMSLFADGGWFATKPYICGSSYILKMSDYPKGEWTNVWDGLYWRFVSRHRELFERNPRMRAALGSLEKMDPGRRERIFAAAEGFIERTAPPAAR